MPAIHVRRGVEFKPDLFAKRDRTEWLDAVGKEIASKGITIKVGEGATAHEVKDSATLQAAYKSLQAAAAAQGRDVQRYIADLVQALDDVIKPTSIMASGDVVDLTKGSELSKVLGLDDSSTLYASTRTEFGKKPDNTFSPLGVRLSRAAPTPTPPVTPPVPPPVTPALDRSLIDNPDGTPKINYIEKASFTVGSTQVGREGIEAEAVREIQGIDGKTLHSIVSEGNTLRRLQKPTASLAFTLGSVPLDEMKWDSDSHAMREKNPFMSISIEAGRGIRKDPESGEWEVQVARDYFFDHLQAAVDVTTGKPTRLLRDHGVAIRGRERIESEDGNASRVLIQSKLNAVFDPVFGVKTALKRDIRTDSPRAGETVENLDKSVQTGKPIGFYSATGADAISAPYDLLASKGVLPDVGPHEDVLAMQTVAYKRQPRGRYHLNETPTDEIRDFFKQSGEVKIKQLADTMAASTNLSAGEKAELKTLSDALLDRSAIVKGAEAALKALDRSITTVDKAMIDKLWPDTPLPSDKLETKKRRVVAEIIKQTYDVFAEKVDELAPKAAGTVDASGNRIRSVRDAPDTGDVRDYMRTKINAQKFMDFAARQSWGVDATKPQTYMDAIPKMRQALRDEESKPANERTITNALESAGIYTDLFDEDVTVKLFEKKLPLDNSLASVETAGPLLKAFDAMLAGADKQAFIEDFAAYLAADGSNRLSNALTGGTAEAMLADTRKVLVADDLEITHRMVESAGTMAKTLGFDAMRKAYSNVERSGWGNFIIDSTDFCEFYDKTEGEKIKGATKGSRNPLDFSKMTDFKMSNDFQIELAYADPYLEAIDKATKALLLPLIMEHAASVSGGATAKEWLEKNLPNEHLVLPQDKAKLDARAAFVKTVADAIKAKTPEIVVDENLLVSLIRNSKGQSIDSFAGVTAGLDAATLATRTDDLKGAKEVWTTMLQAQETIADARGERVMEIINDVARDKGLNINATWGVPTKSKDDHGIDLVVT